MEKPVIAVHGLGMVGGSLASYLQEEGYEVRHFDPPKGVEHEIRDVKFHFLCVPTPYIKEGGGFSLKFIHEAVNTIKNARGDKETVLVIKSTVLPGTTDTLQQEYSDFIFLFNPEFLTEKNADKDMRDPERQIIGYADERGKQYCAEIMNILPKAPYQKAMKAGEAELVKYFGNCFLSVKVIFANMIYDFCENMGLDYEAVKDGASHDSRVGESHLKVVCDGYRGYGGSCFPKDIRALIQLGDRLGVDVSLLKEAERRNFELTGGVDR